MGRNRPGAVSLRGEDPNTITHQAKLVDIDTPVARVAEEVQQLGSKLAILLVQLPPKVAFDAEIAMRFFNTLGQAIEAGIVREPRDASWFDEHVDTMLRDLRVARVAADPALNTTAGSPGGWLGLSYWRLHGSPKMYRSSYGDEAIGMYAKQIQAAIGDGLEPWCMFDNTAPRAMRCR